MRTYAGRTQYNSGMSREGLGSTRVESGARLQAVQFGGRRWRKLEGWRWCGSRTVKSTVLNYIGTRPMEWAGAR